MHPKAILCVDDEAIILMHLVMILERRYGLRYALFSAPNGQQALELIDEMTQRGVSLQAIITDWQMPGIMGDDLVRQAKAKLPELHSIMISGKTDEASLKDLSREIELTGFFPKPLDKQKLFSLLDQILVLS